MLAAGCIPLAARRPSMRLHLLEAATDLLPCAQASQEHDSRLDQGQESRAPNYVSFNRKGSYPDPTQKPVIKPPHLITSPETQKCNQSRSSLVNLANHARLKAINPNRAMDPERLKSRQNRATAGHSQKPTARLSGWQPFRGYRLICSVTYVTS